MRLRRRAEQLTLSAAGRLASQPAWQDDGKDLLTFDGSGLSSSASCARLLPAGSWQRTLSGSLLSSLTGLGGCAMSLRLRATKSGRSLLVPTMSGLRTDGSESGSWPTPENADGSRGSLGHMRGNPTLLGAARLWPTARAEDSESAGAHVARGTAETLTAAARLWPTATSGDSKASGTRTGTPNAESENSHPGTTLTDAANGLWASPQARDWRSGAMTAEGHATRLEHPRGPTLPEQIDRAGLPDQGSSSTSGKRRGSLNPAWVSQLMGFPTGWLAASPPVTAGKR